MTRSRRDLTCSRFAHSFLWLIVLAAAAIAAVFLLGAIMTMMTQSWLVDIAKAHFAATIGLPFAALAAYCIVSLLEIRSGPIEFEGLSFKFYGAAGPAVLWIFAFLAIAGSIKAVW
jgi:hypothetical protein